MTDAELLAAAVADNAAWCSAVCRTHGTGTTAGPDLWVAQAPAPPFHPDVMTQRPGVPAEAVVAALPPRCEGRGAAVKDAYADVDLTAAGFSPLLTGSWLVDTAGGSPDGITGRLTVEAVDDEAGRQRWLAGWRGEDGPADVLLPELLALPGVDAVVVARDGRLLGGATLSTLGPAGVVGICNLFAVTDEPVPVRRAVVAHVAEHLPGRAVVGWEAGDDLVAAQLAGARRLGPMRVWSR